MSGGNQPVGLTRDAGWQVGVSRTVAALGPEEARAFVASQAWLRGDAAAPLDPDGDEIRSFRAGDRVRLVRHLPGLAAPATLQATVRPAPLGTTIRLHGERLGSEAERSLVRERFRAALERLGTSGSARRRVRAVTAGC